MLDFMKHLEFDATSVRFYNKNSQKICSILNKWNDHCTIQMLPNVVYGFIV